MRMQRVAAAGELSDLLVNSGSNHTSLTTMVNLYDILLT